MTGLTQTVTRFLLAPTWVIAFAVLVKGYAETGDGFSAGVIAALGVLLQYLSFGVDQTQDLFPVRHTRRLAQIGLLTALTFTFAPVLWGEPIMTHYPKTGDDVIHLGTVELITAVGFDIGVFLLVLSFCVGGIDLIAHASMRRRRA